MALSQIKLKNYIKPEYWKYFPIITLKTSLYGWSAPLPYQAYSFLMLYRITLFYFFKIKSVLTCLVHLNLNGGPSKTAMVLSSEAVTTLNGREGRKSTELIGLDCPLISPTDVPVSDMNTWPNLRERNINRT